MWCLSHCCSLLLLLLLVAVVVFSFFCSKRLQTIAPPGLYAMPSLENLRKWNGVIFLRSSFYRGGVFKFVMLIPDSYADDKNNSPIQVLLTHDGSNFLVILFACLEGLFYLANVPPSCRSQKRRPRPFCCGEFVL